MAKVTGTVEAATEKFGKFNLLVNDVWYSTKLEYATFDRPKRGDIVEFDDGGSKFLQKVKIVGSGGSSEKSSAGGRGSVQGRSTYRQNGTEGGFPVHPLAYERALDRRNALNAAVSVWNEGGITGMDELGIDTSISLDAIIAIARHFEDYTTGTADYEEAKRMLKDEED